MSKTTKAFLFLYGVLLVTLLAEMLFLYMQNEKKDAGALSFFSDPALYTKERGMRFYSLESASAFFDDPVLPPHSKSDFVYRIRP